jgi:hypothetical protein
MPVSVNQRFKNKFRRAIMWGALALIILLVFLSIYGAFIGPARAKHFFNSVPLAVYWVGFALLLAVAIAAFRRLLRVPALLLVHVGCVLILAGAIWGSEAGHKLQKRLFGIDKILMGQMQIYEGSSDNRVILENDQIRELPFYIGLKDFRIEYYKTEYLLVQTRQGQSWRFPVEAGREFSLGDDFGVITIVRVFRNFKISIDGDTHVAIDDPGPGSNPALEVRIESPDGEVVTRYVFERFPGHGHPGDKLFLSYQRVISDYVSELQVIKDGKVAAEKDIEVNHPLHFGGYHFYQHFYDDEAGRYTVLMVASDTGLPLVYAGYWMLCIGVFWHLWIGQILARVKAKRE